MGHPPGQRRDATGSRDTIRDNHPAADQSTQSIHTRVHINPSYTRCGMPTGGVYELYEDKEAVLVRAKIDRSLRTIKRSVSVKKLVSGWPKTDTTRCQRGWTKLSRWWSNASGDERCATASNTETGKMELEYIRTIYSHAARGASCIIR